jgi:hypothetical protein
MSFATASHEELFAETHELCCDACGAALEAPPNDDDVEESAGVYVWARGDVVQREKAPLCMRCSNTIFAHALGFIDFDDEE